MIRIPRILDGLRYFGILEFEGFEKNGICIFLIDFYQGMFRIIPESGHEDYFSGDSPFFHGIDEFIPVHIRHGDIG
jgi:hypothetical protein